MIQLGKSRGLSDEQIKLLIYQSAHETNNWDSVVYFANNNFFGMRMPRVRKTLASRELNGYAFFDSLNDSFNDMLLYLNYVSINIPNDATFSGITEYANLLKEKDYYTDSFVNYSAGMQNRKNKLDFVFNSIINKLL